ncbi:MAG TPA: glycerophosphodiester phosphodiesterase [Polyangia bacterium]|nr:glycerophosphodiester phosphodiesterase [Polyangia bacterium]
MVTEEKIFVARWGRQAQPLIIAHRGASADAVENTLPAFRLAREQGADGVELDVLRCGSGEVVVFHDDDLARLAHRPEAIRRLPYAALREIDLGAGARIPLLAQVFEELGPLLVNIELKTRPDWLGRARDDGLAHEVAALIRRHAVESRALVSSFDPLLLARFRRAAPAVPTGLLFGADQSRPFRHAWAAPLVQPTALHPEAALVDAPALREWRRRGYCIHTWTVDDPAELRALAALGVDGLITNRPAQARRALCYHPHDGG